MSVRTKTPRKVTLPLITIPEAAARCGVTETAVRLAIQDGRLPVYVSANTHGHYARLVDPDDALRLWSIKKHPLPHRIDPSDISALTV